MDSPLGYISIYEMAFIFLITFLVVGPRRIIRGVKVINEWVHNRFNRVQKRATDTAAELGKAARTVKESASAPLPQASTKTSSAAKPQTSSKTQNVMRGLGRMAGYYRDLSKKNQENGDK